MGICFCNRKKINLYEGFSVGERRGWEEGIRVGFGEGVVGMVSVFGLVV